MLTVSPIAVDRRTAAMTAFDDLRGGDRRTADTSPFARAVTANDTLAARTATTVREAGAVVAMLTESTTDCCASTMLGALTASPKAAAVTTRPLGDTRRPRRETSS